MQRILSEEFINLHLEQLLDQFVDSALWLDQYFDLLLITSTVSFRMPAPSVDRPEAEMERRKRSIKNLVF